MNISKVNSPSTTPKGGRDRAPLESPVTPKRARKPSKAQRDMMEGEVVMTDKAVQALAQDVEDLLLLTRPENEKDTDDVLEATDHLLNMNAQTVRMYRRYEAKWKSYVQEKGVRNEVNDVALRNFFKSLRSTYAPSTLWVIYSCVNNYFKEAHGCDLKTFPKLARYLKAQSSSYVSNKSKTFTAEEIDAVLMYCIESADEGDHLLGVGVALLYYGLLRISDVLKVQVENVTFDQEKKTMVRFEHARKRKNPGFTFHVPARYYALFERYVSSLGPKAAGRFLKNYNVQGKRRIQNTGKHTVETFVKKCCAILDKSSTGYTSHAFRRSAATNLADAGVSFVNLKRHGQWKSDAVVEGYIANSKPLRLERERGLIPQSLVRPLKKENTLKTPNHNPLTSALPVASDDDFVELGSLQDPGSLSLIGFSQVEGTNPDDYKILGDIDGCPIISTASQPKARQPSFSDPTILQRNRPLQPSALGTAPFQQPSMQSLLGTSPSVYNGCTFVFNLNTNDKTAKEGE